jgi:hypothetical protein
MAHSSVDAVAGTTAQKPGRRRLAEFTFSLPTIRQERRESPILPLKKRYRLLSTSVVKWRVDNQLLPLQ